MKKMVLITMLALGLMSGVSAGTNGVPKSINVGEMLTSIQAKEATGWGAQIAYAMKGTVSALTDGMSVTTEQIYKFSESGLGKITIGIIVYNIIGKEILKILFGIPLLIFVCWGMKRWYKYYLSYTVDEHGDRSGVFVDMWNQSGDAAFGAVVILIGSTIASALSVYLLLKWMF